MTDHDKPRAADTAPPSPITSASPAERPILATQPAHLDAPPASPTPLAHVDGLAVPPTPPAHLDALRARLADAAADAELLDLAFRTIDSPVGDLLLATSATGLVRVAFANENFDAVLDTLGAAVGRRILNAPARLDAPARQLDGYFAGRRTAFDLTLDLRLSAGFRRLVQQHLPEIPYGRTASYKEMAALVGNPGAVRAVGTACSTNPLPIVVPCHRVVRSDGSLGGYIGGFAAKQALLDLEHAASER